MTTAPAAGLKPSVTSTPAGRIFNFSAGPDVLPESVLRQIQEDVWNIGGSGIGILEHSHRGKVFDKVLADAFENFRKISNLPKNYHVLFLTGGATAQNWMVPANLKPQDQTADYITTGYWAEKSLEQARFYGAVHEAASSKDKNHSYIPADNAPHLDRMRHCAEVAQHFDARFVRMFSYFIPEGHHPDDYRDEATRRNMNPRMLVEFVDGTKTMVEMTSIGNGTGYAPEKAGAYGPQCTVKDLANIFIPKADGGIFNARGAVDYAVGDVAPGVFVIITTDQPKIIADLNYLRLNGNGKYWALYRPYHLANLECPITVAKAALDNEVTLQTNRAPVAETVACAKRDLAPGDKLDSLGGFTMYGLIDRAEVARAEGMLPLGLAVGATVVKPVKAGQPIRYDDVNLIEDQTILKLRREQDALLA